MSASSDTRIRGDISVRPAALADTGRILELVRLSLGEGSVPRDAAFWSWKHRANPFGESPVLVAEAEGELVGLRAFLRWEWRRGERTYRAVRAVDTATHPEWRGRGIFARLTMQLVDELREEGVAFVFNTPNRKSGPGYIKMGWCSLGRTNLWIRPLRWTAGARRTSLHDGDPAGGAADAVNAAVAGAGVGVDHALAGAGVREWLTTLPGDSAHFRTPRTPEYLRWRYAEVPGIRYGVAADTSDGGAMVIYRAKARGRGRELRLCDLLVGRGRGAGRVARRLLRDVCRASGADFASAMAPFGTREAGVLLASGFLPAPWLGPVLAIRPLAAAESDVCTLVRRSSWAAATIGDLEVF